jgi:outer membrane biosynthesis protein TonB
LRPALLVALAFAFAATLTASARADEPIPTAAAGDVAPPVVEEPGGPAQQTDPGPVSVDPAPQPEPQPQTEPPPPAPEAQQPADVPPAAPAEEQPQTVPDRDGGGGAHDTAAQTASPSSEPTTNFATATQAPSAQAGVTEAPAATTAPLGWDVYDDTLYAEIGDGGDGGSGGFGDGAPSVIRGLSVLGTMRAAAERDKDRDAQPASHAEPISAGGSGPGGSGPGQGPSLGLFGAAGGSGAGIALLTLLGMASGWLLIAPGRMRAFLTSTATWRPSAYVPPIERPG